MQTIDEIINSIKIDKANLEHIAKTGKINGSLLESLRISHKAYAAQAIERCAAEAKVKFIPMESLFEAQVDRDSILNVKSLLK